MTEHVNQAPIRVHVEFDDRITKTTLTVPVVFGDGQPSRLFGRGTAVKHPDDEDNPGIGETLSMVRALEDLAGSLKRYLDLP